MYVYMYIGMYECMYACIDDRLRVQITYIVKIKTYAS